MKIAVYPGSFDPVTMGHLNIITRASKLAEYAAQHGCCTIIKGLRAGSDFEKEFQMAMINRKLNPKLDSLFLTAEHQYMYLSSSVIKEMGYYGADLNGLLPAQIIPEFQERIQQRRYNKEEAR